MLICEVSLVDCAATVFSCASAVPGDGKKDLARCFARWAGLTTGKGCALSGARSQELEIRGNGTCLR